MTVHNLNGALELQDLGFKRVVLSRELSVNDIDYICKNTDVEIETFIHGALCISYSGQCLFSSMIGGRSGNRGKCAGPCRLPFELLENTQKLDSGYLLSTRDLCGLEFIPKLINAGVKCFKIEGRMKNPEYVATVTRIYRKYIDLAYSNEEYVIDENDKKELLQVFNRGMSSSGHLSNDVNRNLVFKEKPSNMGLFLGKVQKFNSQKGYITVKLNEPINVGDTISLEYEDGSYTISELMNMNEQNIKEGKIGETVIIGRMKGNIRLSNNIYKMSSKALSLNAKNSYSKEYKKVPLTCNISIKNNEPIHVTVTSSCNLELYKDLYIDYTYDFIPLQATNRPLTVDTVKTQFEKTSSTHYCFKKLNIDLDENLFIPKLSMLNEIRRNVLDLVTDYATRNIKRTIDVNSSTYPIIDSELEKSKNTSKKGVQISVLLNLLHENYDYSKLENIDNIYIPLKYFSNKNYSNILQILAQKSNLYIYMPTIVKSNYKNLFFANIENTLSNYNIKGFVVSNICNFKLLKSLSNDISSKFNLITNYTFNVYNKYTVSELKKLGAIRYTISPELDRQTIHDLCESNCLDNELMVYGKVPLLNMNYCLLGETDKCYPNCSQRCKNINSTYYLKDRLKMNFRILPDNIQTVTTIFNSKTTSISWKDFNIDIARIDILDEDIETINNIVLKTINGEKFEGKDYTNGNLNREI